jgi:hypothetical protein
MVLDLYQLPGLDLNGRVFGTEAIMQLGIQP